MDNLPEQLRTLWEITVEVWQYGFLGVDVGRMIAALLVFGLFLVVRHLLGTFLMNRLRGLAQRTRTTADDQAVEAIEPPVRFIPVVLGVFFAIEVMEPEGTFAVIGENLVRSLIAFNIFWAFYRAVEPLSAYVAKLEKVFSTAMLDWLVKAVKVGFVLLGAATILELWGIEVAPLLAGLGLFGVAVALGAQDLFKNLIAGVLIIAEKRFNPGDWVLVDGVVEGTVEKLGFRSTLVRRFDKAPVYVPNAKLSDNAVTNFTKMTHRRIYWKIGVEYGTTVDQLRTIRDGIEGYIAGHDEFEKPPAVPMFVRVDSFNNSSIDIMVYCFTRTTVWGEWLEIKERLAYAIKEIVEGAGTGFAFPSRSLYIESVPGERPEVFVPPSPQSGPQAETTQEVSSS
jgi:MscS family membrane protein